MTERLSPLALLGGRPVVTEPWPSSNTIGKEEKEQVLEVLDSGILSGFKAGSGPEFLGGPKVRQLEKEWASWFGVKHAVSFNSLTSGLTAAIGALGIGPGDEVIVPPLTMSASCVAPLWYGAVPVFADIDPGTLCLDPRSIEAHLTPSTRAIMVVHLFGHPADMEGILALAHRRDLPVIEDCAQAPAARYRGKYVGTMGQVGGFSLNIHKTIHCGEGGVMTTDDDELALRLQLIRNHGEAAVEGLGVARLDNTLGGNTRMTEMEAGVAVAQLRKLEMLTQARVRLAAYLDKQLSGIEGLTPHRVKDPESRHVYYLYPLRYDETVCQLPRELFVQAVRAEGIELRSDYARPVYWEPLFQKGIVFGKKTRPFRYPKGLCPVAERAHQQELVFGRFCRWPLTEAHMDQVVQAFKKVLDHRADLMTLVTA